MTDPFDPADWDRATLLSASVVDADSDVAVAIDAAAALDGDTLAAARLGVAGVVAIDADGAGYEVHETIDGWTLVASSGTPDVADLAMAARIRASRLARQRQARRGPR